jgi:MFS family permease
MIGGVADRVGVNRTVLALSLARMSDALGNSILFIVIPLYVAQLPAPWFPFPESVRVGVLISVYGLVNAALQPFMGALSDRIGKRKPLILIGLIVMGTTTFLFIFAHRFADLMLLRVFQGLGVALTIPTSMALMALATRKETRGGSMGLYSSMRIVGFGLGPLLGGFIQVNFGFNTAFATGAAAVFLGALLVQAWVPEAKTKPSASARAHLRIIAPELLSAGLVGAGFASFLMASNFSMMTALETQFNARLDETAFGFGAAFSALMLTRLIFQIPLGRLSDNIGRKPLIIAGLILMAPSTALLGWAASTLQFAGLCLFQGLASAGIAAPAFALAGDLAKTGGEGRQMSVITMGFGLGIALGPLTAGILAVYSFGLPFLIGAGLSLIGAWVVQAFVPETVQRHLSQVGGLSASTHDAAHSEGGFRGKA